MATCRSCGHEIGAGDWTCGRCGASTEASTAGASPTAYASFAGDAPPPTTAASTAPVGMSGLLRLVLALAVVAMIAVVAVWFFVLRGPATSGDEFLGAWSATGVGLGSVVVARPGDDFEVTLTGSRPEQTVTMPAHLDGDELAITIDDFATIAGDANAETFRKVLKALAGDLTIVFSSTDASHLRMRVESTRADGTRSPDTTILTRAVP